MTTISSPPMSCVRILPSLITSNVALAMLLARSSRLEQEQTINYRRVACCTDRTYPRCLNIIVALRIIAEGFALLVPMRSLATCRHPGSNKAYSYSQAAIGIVSH